MTCHTSASAAAYTLPTLMLLHMIGLSTLAGCAGGGDSGQVEENATELAGRSCSGVSRGGGCIGGVGIPGSPSSNSSPAACKCSESGVLEVFYLVIMTADVVGLELG